MAEPLALVAVPIVAGDAEGDEDMPVIDLICWTQAIDILSNKISQVVCQLLEKSQDPKGPRFESTSFKQPASRRQA